jgi:hypothetical protein
MPLQTMLEVDAASGRSSLLYNFLSPSLGYSYFCLYLALARRLDMGNQGFDVGYQMDTTWHARGNYIRFSILQPEVKRGGVPPSYT